MVSPSTAADPTTPVDQYLDTLPSGRRQRLRTLIDQIREWSPEAELALRDEMPTFTIDDNWIRVGQRGKFLSLQTCCYEHISEYRNRHPEIKGGKGCLNFKDSNNLHLKDLKLVVRKSLTLKPPKG